MRAAMLSVMLLAGAFFTAPPARADDAAEKAATEKVLALLKAKRYADGISLADKTFRAWREDHAGARRPGPSASTRPADPTVKLRRQPSAAVKARATAIVDAVYAVTAPEALEHLVKVRTPELALYSAAAAVNIGVKLCEQGKVAEGIRAVLAGCEAKKNREMPISTPDKSYPKLLGYRLPPNPLGRLQAALSGKDPVELAKAYGLISPEQDKQNITHTILHASFAWTAKPADPPAKALAVLAAAMKDPRPTRRRMAATMLHARYERKPKIRDAAVALLTQHLEDKDNEVRFHVAVSLIRWGDPAGVDPVMTLPRPRQFLPSKYPLDIIGSMGLRKATRWIIQFADQYPTSGGLALTALWRMGDPEAVPFLGRILESEKALVDMRALAANALAATMSDDAVPYLERTLKKAPPRLRERILVLMTEFRPKLTLPILIDAMKGDGHFGDQPPTRNMGAAWVRLRFCTGLEDPAAEYKKDKAKLRAAMEAYWQGKFRHRQIVNQIRHHVYAEPDAKKVDDLRRQLADLAKKAPPSCFRGFW